MTRWGAGRLVGSRSFVVVSVVLGLMSNVGCGMYVTQRDYEALAKRSDETAKEVEKSRGDLEGLKSDLAAVSKRLDNALRANADNSADSMSDKARLQALGGRVDEATRNIEDLKRELASTRTEADSRLDEMKRLEAPAAMKAPPVQIPPEREKHYAAFEAAYNQRDWGLTRTLGHEYANRYPTDEKTDDALYFMGDADMKDNKPSSALGEFNRVLKSFPKSNVLDKTLMAMGRAYLSLHDCANAKLAFSACASHFPREKIALEAKQQLAVIDKAPPGLCETQPR